MKAALWTQGERARIIVEEKRALSLALDTGGTPSKQQHDAPTGQSATGLNHTYSRQTRELPIA